MSGETGGGLTAAERAAADRAEAQVLKLADELCKAAHDPDPAEGPPSHCQECYALACECMDTPTWADANARLAEVEAAAEELREMAGDHSERLSDFEDGYSAACADADLLVRAALHPDSSETP